jgi:putative Ca2+/H+ antiporter (TMEM165/GDT1 family)
MKEYFAQLVNGSDFLAAFVNSFIMILVTEIGDKTFFIAAVLAMRNGRIFVYAGAMSALTAMHLLSSLMGYALPALLSRKYTNIASTVSFILLFPS